MPIEAPIDLSLFAHIHNDSRLLGTILQGNTFLRTVSYVMHTLTALEQKYPHIQPTLTRAKNDFESLLKIQRQCTNLIYEQNNNPGAKPEEEGIKVIADDIHSSLEKDGQVLMPGGWSGTPSGHAMGYKFIKEPDGSYKFLIYNTGSGINHHQSEETSKQSYLPVKAYQIPATCSPQELKRFMQTLLVPCIKPSLVAIASNHTSTIANRQNGDRLYHEVIGKIAYLEGSLIDAKAYCSQYIQGQESGTCAMRVLMPLLHDDMKDEIAFELVIYELELQSILELYEIEKNKPNLGDAQLQRQFRFAVEQFAIKTKNCVEQAIISMDEAKLSLSNIEKIIKDLDANQLENSSTRYQLPIPEETVFKPLTPQFFNMTSSASKLESLEVAPVSMPIREPNESINTFLLKCYESCVLNDKNKYIDKLLYEIEQLFLTLPVAGKEAKKYWSTLDQDEARTCLNLIEGLINFYGTHCYLKGNYALAKQHITAELGALITWQLEVRYFEQGDKAFPSYAFNFKSIKIEDNAESVTMDPDFDTKLVEIRAGLAEQCAILYANSHDYYEIKLIEKYGLIKQLCELDVLGATPLDNARINLYKLVKGVFPADRDLTPFVGLLQDFKFYLQCHELQKACLSPLMGQVSDYFKCIISPEQHEKNRVLQLKYSRTFSPREIDGFNEHTMYNFLDEFAQSSGAKKRACYSIQDSLIQSVLFNNKRTSNAALIEFSNEKYQSSLEETALNHTIPFTRLQDDCFVITTLDYFQNNMDRLSNNDYQTLFLLNLMSEKMLHEQLSRAPDIAKKLVDFTLDLVRYNTKNVVLGEGGYFAFKLSYYLLKYFKTSPNAKDLSTSIKRLKALDTQLQRYTPTNPRLSTSYLLRFSECFQDGDKISSEELVLFLKTLLLRHTTGENKSTNDPIEESELYHALIKISPFIKQQFEVLSLDEKESCLNKSLESRLKTVGKPFVLHFDKFPLVSVISNETILQWDLSTGMELQNGTVYTAIPASFYTPEFSAFFGDKRRFASVETSQEYSCCEFQEDHKHYRVFIGNNLTTTIHLKKGDDWYELQPDRLKLINSAFSPNATSAIPAQFYEQGTQWWINKTGQGFIRDNRGFELVLFNSTPQLTFSQGEYTLFKPQENCFNHFESEKFSEFWTNGSSIIARFPRYHLEFNIEKNADGKEEALCVSHPLLVNYRLCHDNLNLIPGFSHVLYLENKNDPKERIALIPKQDFYSTGEKVADSEYYRLIFDTTNEINNHNIEEKNQKTDGSSNKYTNTEQFVSYKITDQTLIAESPRDKLYLASIYLASHQPIKALEYLRQCEIAGGIKGTLDEVELIQRILEGVPNPNYNKEMYKEARTNEPEVRAVRLTAAALLALHKTIHFDTLLPSSTHDKEKADKLMHFYKEGFKKQLEQNYREYWNTLGNVPESMKLSLEKERSILRALFKGYNKPLQGFIQGRWYELELMQLKAQREKLQDKPSHSKRLEEIDAILARGNRYSVNVDSLSTVQTTVIPEPLQLDEKMPKTCFYGDPDDWKRWYTSESPALQLFVGIKPSTDRFLQMPVVTLNVDDLNLDVSSLDFVYSSQVFYELAIAPLSSENTDDKKKLRLFLEKTLKYNLDSNITDLAKIFIYALQSPLPTSSWPKFERYSSGITSFTTQLVSMAEAIAKENPIVLEQISLQKEMVDYQCQQPWLTEIKSGLTPKIALQNNVEFCLSDQLKLQALVKRIKEARPALQTPFVSITSSQEETEPFLKHQFNRFLLDYEKGHERNQQTLANAAVYCEVLNIDERKAILERLTKHQSDAYALLKTSKKDLLVKANKALISEQAPLKTRLTIFGKHKNIIDFAQLLTLYLQGEMQGFIDKTELEPEEINDLWQAMHDYLLEATALQQRERVSKLLNDSLKPGVEDSEIAKLGEQLTTSRCYSPSEHPDILVFEYCEGKLVRPSQIKMIRESLKEEKGGYKNKITHLTMGSGKSKVISPILALKKARGTNLVIIEEPAATFETSLIDLQATLVHAFGIQGYPFIFDRQTDCSSANFIELYTKWEQIILNRGCIITTPESIQALELKYLELLDTPYIDNKKEWELTVTHLERLLKLLKEQGDVIIDEVDTNLTSKKELIFTLGTSLASIPQETLKVVLDFYNFFSEVYLTRKITLEQLVHNNKLISDEKIWNQLPGKLAHALIIKDKSPVASFVNELSLKEKKEFKAYFLNKTPTPTFVASLVDESLKNKIALIKGELDIIAVTLKKNINEHYGFSKSTATEIAKPYLASNVPNEKADFGSVYCELINYTIQLHKQHDRPLSLKVVSKFVSDFYNRASTQLMTSSGRLQFIQTDAAIEFKQLTGFALESLDNKNQSGILQLQKDLTTNKKAKDYCLIQYVLNEIKHYPNTLKSNASNHLSQFRSAEGFTGTPWNHRCYRQLAFDPDASLGVDGETIDRIIKDKSPVHIVDDINTLMETVYQTHPKKNDIRAIIDVGALFRGIPNEAVAIDLYQFLAAKLHSNIKAILYFDDSNQLCAWTKDGRIEIGGSETKTILEKTGYDPEKGELFTYYDQRHTTGTDIFQPKNTTAFLTVDDGTIARDYCQGDGRLRDPTSHHIEHIIPRTMANAYAKVTHWTSEEIIKIVVKNQSETLSELHFRAATQQMQNIIRQTLLTRIYGEYDLSKKQRLRHFFSEVFVEEDKETLYQKFCNMSQNQATLTILNNLKLHYLTKWERLLNEASIDVEEEEKIHILGDLELVVNDIKDYCYKQRKHYADPNRDSHVVIETEKEKETEHQVEQLISRKTIAAKPLPWVRLLGDIELKNPLLSEDALKTRLSTHYGTKIMPLNIMLESASEVPSWQFDRSIYVSDNFINTYQQQQDKTNQYRKPINFYLVERLYDQLSGKDELKALILTQEEVSELLQTDFTGSTNTRMIVSPNGTVFSGNTALMEHPDYEKIREQICFFNGDLDNLAQNPASIRWLNSQRDKKLQYLETVILPNFPEKRTKVQPLLNALNAFERMKSSFIKALTHENANDKEAFSKIKPYLSLSTSLSIEGETALGFSLKHLNLTASDLKAILQNQNLTVVNSHPVDDSLLLLALKKENEALLPCLLEDRRFFPPNPFDDAALWYALLDASLQQDKPDLSMHFITALIQSNDHTLLEKIKEIIPLDHPSLLVRLIAKLDDDLLTRFLNLGDSFWPDDSKDNALAWCALLTKAIENSESALLDLVFGKITALSNETKEAMLASFSIQNSERFPLLIASRAKNEKLINLLIASNLCLPTNKYDASQWANLIQLAIHQSPYLLYPKLIARLSEFKESEKLKIIDLVLQKYMRETPREYEEATIALYKFLQVCRVKVDPSVNKPLTETDVLCKLVEAVVKDDNCEKEDNLSTLLKKMVANNDAFLPALKSILLTDKSRLISFVSNSNLDATQMLHYFPGEFWHEIVQNAINTEYYFSELVRLLSTHYGAHLLTEALKTKPDEAPFFLQIKQIKYIHTLYSNTCALLDTKLDTSQLLSFFPIECWHDIAYRLASTDSFPSFIEKLSTRFGDQLQEILITKPGETSILSQIMTSDNNHRTQVNSLSMIIPKIDDIQAWAWFSQDVKTSNNLETVTMVRGELVDKGEEAPLKEALKALNPYVEELILSKPNMDLILPDLEASLPKEFASAEEKTRAVTISEQFAVFKQLQSVLREAAKQKEEAALNLLLTDPNAWYQQCWSFSPRREKDIFLISLQSNPSAAQVFFKLLSSEEKKEDFYENIDWLFNRAFNIKQVISASQLNNFEAMKTFTELMSLKMIKVLIEKRGFWERGEKSLLKDCQQLLFKKQIERLFVAIRANNDALVLQLLDDLPHEEETTMSESNPSYYQATENGETCLLLAVRMLRELSLDHDNKDALLSINSIVKELSSKLNVSPFHKENDAGESSGPPR